MDLSLIKKYPFRYVTVHLRKSNEEGLALPRY